MYANISHPFDGGRRSNPKFSTLLHGHNALNHMQLERKKSGHVTFRVQAFINLKNSVKCPKKSKKALKCNY